MSDGAELLEGLNPVQRDAVSAPDGPILVVAGAGSGKTRLLTHRVAYLIAERGVSPFELLAITFTNKAAGEMKERVGALVGPVARRMWVSTFHSACARILRREATVLGYRSSFSIYDESDAVRLVDYVRRDLNLDPKRFPPRRLHHAISALKNELVEPEEAKAKALTQPEVRIAEVYVEYQRRLAEASAADFDDLLLLVVRLFREHPDVLDRWRHRFGHVLVDEFQDTNVAQWELVRLLTREHRNVMVVGDADQSVYKFRGADHRNLMRFEEEFPEASIIVLDQNYRSTPDDPRRRQRGDRQQRGAAAEAPLDRAGRRRAHHPVPRRGRARRGQLRRARDRPARRRRADAVRRRRGLLPDERAEPRGGGGVRPRRACPYRIVGGTKFYDRREIKDALAYLRALANPDDEVGWKRIVNMPKRGVGDTSVRKIEAYAQGAEVVFRDALHEAAAAGVTGRALGGIRDLLEVMTELERSAAELGVGGVVEAMLDQTGYLAELEAERTIEAQGRIENLSELVGVGARLRRAPRRRRPVRPRRDRGSGDVARPRSPRPPTGLARCRRSSRRSRS